MEALGNSSVPRIRSRTESGRKIYVNTNIITVFASPRGEPASRDTYLRSRVRMQNTWRARVRDAASAHVRRGDSRRSRFSAAMNDEFAQSPGSTRLTLPVNIPRYTGCPATRERNFNDGLSGVILRADFALSKHVHRN